MKKYGKSIKDVISTKSYFSEQNDKLVSEEKKSIDFYKLQPKRLNCKICSSNLIEVSLIRKSINYYQCKTCGHLNGQFEDTNEFLEFNYTKENPDDYRREYQRVDVENYLNKVKNVYVPKVDFLFKSLKEDNIDPSNLSYLDVGTGVGHLVYAMNKEFNIDKIEGIEVSKSQVEMGNEILKTNKLKEVGLNEIIDYIKSAKVDVLSAIMVLEHLQSPSIFFQAINNNKNIKYFYLAVPLFNLTTYFQLAFPDVFERILYSGHTHLYTKESINYLVNRYNFEIKSEWWFSSDIHDLYRSLRVMMEKNSQPLTALDGFDKKFLPLIDGLQLQLDKSETSSEVHILLKKREF